MPEPKDIAIAALKRMISKVGPKHEFPGDAIWEYAEDEVEATKRPSVFRPLSIEGYIEATGRMTRAVTRDRRASPATEYRFGPKLTNRADAQFTSSAESIFKIANDFQSACEGNLRFNGGVGRRLVASLLSKRFLILTGLAGSGKTKIAQAFARWITPTTDSAVTVQCYELVPVGADWTGNENVLGYPNGLDTKFYVSKPALDLILRAAENKDVPHFLILDEMNLSHVERYFADILSAIESEEEIPLYEGDHRQCDGRDVPRRLGLPDNLFIIGTVNVDETTYMFSPKVLDRAHVIEFRMDENELAEFLKDPVRPDLSQLDGRGALYGVPFTEAAAKAVEVPPEVKAAHKAEMLLFFRVLRERGAEYGYRVAHEAARFVHYYKLLGNHPDDDSWFAAAFDCVVVQKFLPKLHGSRARLGPLLRTLWFLCVHDDASRGDDPLKAASEAARSTDKNAEPSTAVPAGAPYPLSAEKIARMWRLMADNGFASFAEA